MSEEWMDYLYKTRHDLWQAAVASREHDCGWRDRRIAELEAENETGKWAYADLLANSMREVKAAQDALGQVRGLPEKWRSYEEQWAGICADELAAALKP